MIYVLYSVLCSVSVSVLLKWARKNSIDTTQMIFWNYPVAAVLTYYFFKPALAFSEISHAPWSVFVALAILLPTIFIALSASIRRAGLVKTEIAQRLSLVIPLVAAFLLFGENPTTGSTIGIIVGFIAIVLSIGWHKGGPASHRRNTWLFALIVFVGYGVIDVLFKTVAQANMSYTTAMFVIFCMALVVALVILCYRRFAKNHRLTWTALFWGLFLGALNFGNILFYMRAHRALPDQPSIVFTGMNIGVISLGALVGVLFFNEKLSLLNKIGFTLAILAVLIIAYYL